MKCYSLKIIDFLRGKVGLFLKKLGNKIIYKDVDMHLAKKIFFLHYPIIFMYKLKQMLSVWLYMIATGYLD